MNQADQFATGCMFCPSMDKLQLITNRNPNSGAIVGSIYVCADCAPKFKGKVITVSVTEPEHAPKPTPQPAPPKSDKPNLVLPSHMVKGVHKGKVIKH